MKFIPSRGRLEKILPSPQTIFAFPSGAKFGNILGEIFFTPLKSWSRFISEKKAPELNLY